MACTDGKDQSQNRSRGQHGRLGIFGCLTPPQRWWDWAFTYRSLPASGWLLAVGGRHFPGLCGVSSGHTESILQFGLLSFLYFCLFFSYSFQEWPSAPAEPPSNMWAVVFTSPSGGSNICRVCVDAGPDVRCLGVGSAGLSLCLYLCCCGKWMLRSMLTFQDVLSVSGNTAQGSWRWVLT